MSYLRIDFFFEDGRGDLTHQLQIALRECKSLKIVSGFVTERGVADLGEDLENKLDLFIFGHANGKALQAMSSLYDRLEKNGKKGIIKIHFGYGHESEQNKLHYVYRPMMHSKIFLFDYDNGLFVAFVGSQNVTGYSLEGMNSEALVRIEGNITDPIYSKLISSINKIETKAELFDKRFAWEYELFHENVVKGMLSEIERPKREYLSLIYAFYDIEGPIKPALGHQIYFEVPENEQGSYRSIQTRFDVWLYPVNNGLSYGTHSTDDILYFRAIQNLAANAEGVIASGIPKVEWHMQSYKRPILEYLNTEPTVGNFPIQVKLQLKQSFKEAYPERRMSDIRYVAPTRNSYELTPRFDLSDISLMRGGWKPIKRPQRDKEIMSHNAWHLIRGFKQFDSPRQLSLSDDYRLPKPSNVSDVLREMKEGVFFKYRVRANEE